MKEEHLIEDDNLFKKVLEQDIVENSALLLGKINKIICLEMKRFNKKIENQKVW